MLTPLKILDSQSAARSLTHAAVSGRRIGRVPKTVNHATVVYPPLPRNVDPIPWLARPGYVKKPQDSSTYARSVKSFKVRFMESMITNGKPKLAGLKVLVIDDSKTIRRTAETLLTKEGCEVFTAVDGFDALSKIADHQPDIVFVDIMMPRLDGYQTCSLIKHNKVFKQIPVIMLSSKDGLFDRARGRIVGSEHYLTKPFTKDELLGAIEAHVAK
jgi:twitching motility two-component system response regulator PilG